MSYSNIMDFIIIITYQKMCNIKMIIIVNNSLFNEFVCNLGFFWHEWASLKLE
jgi:hypothetical protein